jgi:hypothetical protein
MKSVDGELSDHLVQSSSDFARSALQAMPDQKNSVFLLHAATALEHLAKAFLSTRHPSLIVARNDFESLLHACGESTYAHRPRARIRTITAGEALSRAARFIPELAGLGDDLELLILVRNGIAHLGNASSSDAEDALIPYLKASERLRDALDLDREEYWGEFVELVDSALEENVKRARLRVETALPVARNEFERRFGALDDTTRAAMLSVIESGYKLEKYEEQLLECPACETQGVVYGSLKLDYEPDYDRDGFVDNASLIVTFVPSSFWCAACGLELDGREELDAAGIEEPWVLEDVDEADFAEDHEW